MRHRNVGSSWLALVLLTGCGAVLGIDDAHVDPTFHPGAGAAGASAGGASSQGGADATGGASGAAAGAGGDTGMAGMPPAGVGGMPPAGVGGMSAGGTGGAPAGGMGGMAPGGMGPGGMAPGGMGGMAPGGMGPGGMGGMGPGGMGGMGCGTSSTTPVMNGGVVMVTVIDCSVKTGSSPHLRVGAHPGNTPTNPPSGPPFLDVNPKLPETLTLTPGDGLYVVDALLDYPPYINPPEPPMSTDATANVSSVLVASPMGASVTLWLH